MNIPRYSSIGLAVSVLAMTLGMSTPASAGAGTTFCGYRAISGSAQWTDRYVGKRQCPATSVNGGTSGYLVYSEYIA